MKIFFKILKFWENIKIRWMIVADAPKKRVTIFVVFVGLSQSSGVQLRCSFVERSMVQIPPLAQLERNLQQNLLSNSLKAIIKKS
jgi:hypothetical protein